MPETSVMVRGLALIVDDDPTNRLVLQALLKKSGFDVIEAENGEQAIEKFNDNKIDIVFMDVMMPVMDGYEATARIKAISEKKEIFVPIIFLTALIDETALSKCIEAGGDDFISKPYNITLLKSKIIAIERIRDMSRKLADMYSRIKSDEEIAEKVFSNAVHSGNLDNKSIKTILRSADIFSGDMYLSAYSPSRDINILLGDFTGHGLAAALGALPVSDVFNAMSSKGFSISDIINTINKKLKALLPPGMFMACQAIQVNHELTHLTVCNCGMPSILIKSGESLQEIPSSTLPLGIIDNINAQKHIQHCKIQPGDRLILSSDGVTEALNDNRDEFGEEQFKEIVLKSDSTFCIDDVIRKLDAHCGKSRQLDDISLVEVSLKPELLPVWDISALGNKDDIEIDRAIVNNNVSKSIELSFEIHGQNISEIDPVPTILNNLTKVISTTESHAQSLFAILTELYVNALDHGVLKLDSKMKKTPDGFADYFKLREERLKQLTDEFIKIHVNVSGDANSTLITIRVEDSGEGFNVENITINTETADSSSFGRGLLLVSSLCKSLQYKKPGNIAEAVYICHNE